MKLRNCVQIGIALLLSCCLVSTATAAGFTNGSFETSDLSGWTTYIPPGGYVQVVPSGAGKAAIVGSQFALLKTDGPGSYTTLSQTITVGAGEKIGGWAFFNAADYLPFNDNAQVYIRSGGPAGPIVATVFSASVSTVGDYGETPWTHWDYTFPTAGTYTVQARIANEGDSAVDSHMGVDGVTFAPDCSNAAPSIAEIWPPNHKMVDIDILGVTDPDGDPVTIAITKITQDEPVNGKGDGNTDQDGAGIGSATAQVRAERSGSKKSPGNGRVYEITFLAADDKGTTCEGSVTVCVPHDRGKSACVDDGQFWNSVTGIGPAAKLALAPEAEMALGNYPNPFNPATTIRYSLSEASSVRLAVYNLLGQEVRLLLSRQQAAGSHSVVWDGRDAIGREMTSGIYLYKLVAGPVTAVRKMILAK